MGKICKGCKKPNDYPLNKFCKICHYDPMVNVKLNLNKTQSTIQRSAVNPISAKRKKRLAEGGGEVPTFMKVYEHYKARCILTGQTVTSTEEGGLPPSYCFPHLLAKGMFPHLRTFRSNIVLVHSLALHGEVDKAMNTLKREIGIKELEAMVIRGEDIAPHIKRIYEASQSK